MCIYGIYEVRVKFHQSAAPIPVKKLMMLNPIQAINMGHLTLLDGDMETEVLFDDHQKLGCSTRI